MAYGQYETGRSKNPSRKSPFTSPCFKDGMIQQVMPERNLSGAYSAVQGDPGAYEPYEYEDSGTNPEREYARVCGCACICDGCDHVRVQR